MGTIFYISLLYRGHFLFREAFYSRDFLLELFSKMSERQPLHMRLFIEYARSIIDGIILKFRIHYRDFIYSPGEKVLFTLIVCGSHVMRTVGARISLAHQRAPSPLASTLELIERVITA